MMLSNCIHNFSRHQPKSTMKLQMLFTLPKMVNSFWYRTKPSHVVNWREKSVTRETPLPTNRRLNPHHPSRISLARHRFLTHPILQLGELLLDKHVIGLSLDAIDFQDDCFLQLVVVILFFLLHLDSANCLFQQKQERRRRMRRRLCFFVPPSWLQPRCRHPFSSRPKDEGPFSNHQLQKPPRWILTKQATKVEETVAKVTGPTFTFRNEKGTGLFETIALQDRWILRIIDNTQ